MDSVDQENPTYFDVKALSKYLNIKVSTLYAWASRNKLPHIKIHGLIRFHKEDIDSWVESFRNNREPPFILFQNKDRKDIDSLIENAKREVYNSDHGETRPKSAQRKEKENGAV